MLVENIKQLGGVIGTGLIGALKPLVKYLNTVITRLTEFARVVVNTLGHIFGWEYDTGGGITQDTEDAEGATDGIASNMKDAANSAKKLKDYTLGIDELNIINPDTGDSGDDGGGGGGTAGTTDLGSAGEWVKKDGLLENFMSEIDTLEQLGAYIAEKITGALNGIDWNATYQGARNFGRGLAQFLNGLLTENGLFDAIGRTAAGNINTALHFLDSFGETFDFRGFGESLAGGLNSFMSTMDWGTALSASSNWGRGLAEQLSGFLATTDFKMVGSTLANALNTAFTFLNTFGETMEWSELGNSIADALDGFFRTWDAGLTAQTFSNFATGLLEGLTSAINKLRDNETFKEIGQKVVDFICNIDWIGLIWDLEQLSYALSQAIVDMPLDFGEGLAEGIVEEITGMKVKIDTPQWVKDIWKYVTFPSPLSAKKILESDWFNDATQGIRDFWDNEIVPWFTKEKWQDVAFDISVKVNDFKEGVKKKWDETVKYWKNKDILGEVTTTYQNFKDKVKEGWGNVVAYWEEKDILGQVKTTYENFKGKVQEGWGKVVNYWKEKDVLGKVTTTYENFKSNVREKWIEVLNYWKEKNPLEKVKTTYENFKSNVREKWIEVLNYWKEKNPLGKISTKIQDFKEDVKDKWIEVRTYWAGKLGLSDISANIADFKQMVIDAWKKLTGWWDTHRPKLSDITANIKLPHLKVTWDTEGWAAQALQKLGLKGFPNFKVEYYEAGGYPTDGSLFWAGEHGIPELLGTVGGKTAVAGGAEITGIKDAVYSTGQAETTLLTQAVALLREIADKDMSVNIGDRDIARANNRGQRALGRRLITEV